MKNRAIATNSDRSIQRSLRLPFMVNTLFRCLRTTLLILGIVLIGWGLTIAPGGTDVEATDLPNWRTMSLYSGPHYNTSSFMLLGMPYSQIRVTGYGLYSSTSGDFRMGFYAGGGGYFDPSGAVLVNDTGILTHNGGGWQTFDVNFDVDYINYNCGIAFKTSGLNGASFFSFDDNGEPGQVHGTYDLSADDPVDVNDPFNPVMGQNTALLDWAIYYYLEYSEYAIITSAPSTLSAGKSYSIYGPDIRRGEVWLTQNPDWDNPGIKVQQSKLGGLPDNSSIYFRVTFGGLTPGTQAYIWVVTDLPNKVPEPIYLEIPEWEPPVEIPGTLTVTQDDGIYVSSSFLVSETFDEPDTRVYNCAVSIDGSSLLFSGVSIVNNGDGTYTCNSPALSGTNGQNLTIQMMAYSGGGESTPVATLSRTVDAIGPDIGIFTATNDVSGSCTLDWSNVIDAGTGLHLTQPYELWRKKLTPSYEKIYSGTDTSYIQTGLDNGTTYYYKLWAIDGFGNRSEFGGNPIACTPPAVIINDGVSPLAKFSNGSDTDLAVSSFALSVTEGTETITDLTVTGTGTANAGNVRIYEDAGSIANEYDSGDTLIDTGVFIGTEASFTGLNIPVSPAPVQYLITFDIIAVPTNGDTLTGYISAAATQSLPIVNNDDADITITIDTVPPVTSDDTPVVWLAEDGTVILTPIDGSGSGVDTATGVYGCLGAGCTPIQLDLNNSLTSSCGVGQSCSYEVRYYSIDNTGNTEGIKTAADLLKIDGVAPVAGTFEALDNYPIVLKWSAYSDTDSGIASYTVRRADGSVPPADCSSGYLRYQGTATLFSDSGFVNGQQYSYRLCGYDSAGNSSSLVDSATAEYCLNTVTCNSCHGTPPGSGASNPEVWPPGGHLYHGGECMMCHREGGDAQHVDGIITIQFDSGWNWPTDVEWPTGGVGGSCGGQSNPVGCHMGGSTNYPSLTPEWECFWDDSRMCNPPPGQ